jgi:polyisoprenoid-binding protein YceI
VKKPPFAKLAVTKAQYFENNQVRINGNLTIKGVPNPIKFNTDLDYKSKIKNNPISDAIGFEKIVNL